MTDDYSISRNNRVECGCIRPRCLHRMKPQSNRDVLWNMRQALPWRERHLLLLCLVCLVFYILFAVYLALFTQPLSELSPDGPYPLVNTERESE